MRIETRRQKQSVPERSQTEQHFAVFFTCSRHLDSSQNYGILDSGTISSWKWYVTSRTIIRNITFHIYIRRLDDINVQACACDSLYRTITKFSFFAVLERWRIYDYETECSFAYLIILHIGLVSYILYMTFIHHV